MLLTKVGDVPADNLIVQFAVPEVHAVAIILNFNPPATHPLNNPGVDQLLPILPAKDCRAFTGTKLVPSADNSALIFPTKVPVVWTNQLLIPGVTSTVIA